MSKGTRAIIRTHFFPRGACPRTPSSYAPGNKKTKQKKTLTKISNFSNLYTGGKCLFLSRNGYGPAHRPKVIQHNLHFRNKIL